jgi:hypothetical protein
MSLVDPESQCSQLESQEMDQTERSKTNKIKKY